VTASGTSARLLGLRITGLDVLVVRAMPAAAATARAAMSHHHYYANPDCEPDPVL